MPQPPAWATPANNYPAHGWMSHQQQQQQPPSSAQSWTHGGQYPPLTPLSTWTAPTPAGSWGPPTPGGSLGPPTPASANTNGANWVQGQQEYYTPFAQESAAGQPIGASPWFNGGDGYSGAAANNQLARRSPSRKKSKRYSSHATPDPKQQQHYPQFPTVQMQQQNPYPNIQMERTASQELGGAMGYPLQRSTSLGGGPRLGYTMGSSGYPQSEEYNARNLARRPRDWRPDYDSRAGLASYIPRVGRPRSDVLGSFPISSL